MAFLFPGQGSQYPDMVRDLAVHFRPVREEIERAERTLADAFEQPLGSLIYPPPVFTAEDKDRRTEELKNTTGFSFFNMVCKMNISFKGKLSYWTNLTPPGMSKNFLAG